MEWTQTQTEVAKKESSAPPAKSGDPKQQRKSIAISELSISQLQNVGKQNHQEFQMLKQSMTGLKAAGTNFYGARAAVQSWKENLEMGDTGILVPMTNSLLVSGHMQEGKMLVELGGGILMEKTIDESIAFLDRRMKMVTTSMNKCGSELQQKAMAGQAIEKEMESKMKELNLYNKIYQ